MTTRRYEQRLRAKAALDTRRRILDAMADRLGSAPAEPLSLDKVAEVAEVARSTIYTVFGSRAGLFEAFTTDLWERSGLAELTRAVEVADARAHLRGGIGAACRMYAGNLGIYRVLFSMSRVDPDALAGAVAQKERNRSGGMAYLAQRLSDQGALRADITAAYAADLLWMLCSFEAFDLLLTGRHMSVEDAATALADTAERALCTPLAVPGR
jgi:AcrR family transcriptional regulator